MVEHRRKRRRLWRRRRVWIPLAILLVIGASRNLVAHALLERLGGSFVGNDVSIGRVHLTFRRLRIFDVRICEPSSAELPQLLVKRVDMHFFASLPEIRNGLYLRELDVESPELHLRFDRDGNLLSEFPSLNMPDQPGAKTAIPFRELAVSNANLIVHQEGKPSLRIVADQLTARSTDRIHIECSIADLLGGKAKLVSLLDARSLEGETKLSKSSEFPKLVSGGETRCVVLS